MFKNYSKLIYQIKKKVLRNADFAYDVHIGVYTPTFKSEVRQMKTKGAIWTSQET